MENPLAILNLDYFVQRINAQLHDSEENVEITEFAGSKPWSSSFLDRIRRKEVSFTGNATLTQTQDGLLGICGCERDVKIGSVIVEKGFCDIDHDSMEANHYETMNLRLTSPIKLRNDAVIPPCNVKLMMEGESAGEPSIYRVDHRKRIMGWSRSDLSVILPTEWFLPEGLKYIKSS